MTFCGQMMRAGLVNYYKSCSLNSLRVVARLVFFRLIFSGFSFSEIDTRTRFAVEFSKADKDNSPQPLLNMEIP